MYRAPNYLARVTLSTCLALGSFSSASSARSTSAGNPGDIVAAVGVVIDPELRLATVGYRLAQANAAHCDKPAMTTGLMFHNLADYAPNDRAAAKSRFRLTDGFGILHVVKGSIADSANLQAGDEIVSVNGVDMAQFHREAVRTKASFARTEKFLDYLEAVLANGEADLLLRRRSATVAMRLSGQPGCGGRTAMIRRGGADAWSDGRYVAVTKAMLDLATDDSELAFVIAHEMAHNIARDAERRSPLGGLFLQFGIGASRAKKAEQNADVMAITLMVNAGYDTAAAERLLRKSARSHRLDLAITHPSIAQRITIVRQAIAALDRPRLAGRGPS